jgi:TPP-dependent pyruvate/acetoin dehydrogenase alpha subunit
MNKKELITFRENITRLYSEGKIRGPIHLRDGNEQILIDLFKHLSIGPKDYVFSTWANSFHALLKGVPSSDVIARILEGESMAMNFPEYNFFTSAIVGGICPIAVGVAYSQKVRVAGRTYCFLGDMAFRTGIAHESIMYAISHDLPITFIVEDNGKSVGTPTQDAWGNVLIDELVEFYQGLMMKYIEGRQEGSKCRVVYYKYELSGPHSGTGVFLSF